MAYIHGYGPGDRDNGSSEPPDEPVDYNRSITAGVAFAALAILVTSAVASNVPDTTPWTSGSVTLGLAAAALVLAAVFVYRSVRAAGGSPAESGLALLTVLLAAPLLAASGYVVLAIFGLEQ
jgi:hypothetical protein